MYICAREKEREGEREMKKGGGFKKIRFQCVANACTLPESFKDYLPLCVCYDLTLSYPPPPPPIQVHLEYTVASTQYSLNSISERERESFHYN